MAKCLFVYGSLGPGRPNEHVLANIGGSWQTACVRGRLHEEGWGAELGFPGISLDEAGEHVEGFLFSSERLADYWAELDAFEGEAYERVLARVELDDRSVVEAYIYTLRRKPG